jgi:hypothetical protein
VDPIEEHIGVCYRSGSDDIVASSDFFDSTSLCLDIIQSRFDGDRLDGFHFFSSPIDSYKLRIRIGLRQREEWPTTTSTHISHDHVRLDDVKLDDFQCIEDMFVIDSLFVTDRREVEFSISFQKSGDEECSIIHDDGIMIQT